MNREELVSKMAEEAQITKATASKALEAFISGVTDCLAKKEKLTLVGFGTFMVSARAARKGRNPQTGESIDIPAVTMPKFKPGSKLKEAVNR
ncbi:MAG: HU family DNA-binding protein [bacterium]